MMVVGSGLGAEGSSRVTGMGFRVVTGSVLSWQSRADPGDFRMSAWCFRFREDSELPKTEYWSSNPNP